MRDNWQNKYSKLTEFVSRQSGITITENLVSIPNSIRADFYSRFDDVRRTFIEQSLPVLLEQATELSKHVTQVKLTAMQQVELESITFPDRLDKFIEEPLDFLTRDIFDPLFDLMKEKIDIGTFSEIACNNIYNTFMELYPRGYEKWVELALLLSFKADRFYQFAEQEVSLYDEHRAAGVVREEVAVPKESVTMMFRDRPDTAFMVPDYVIHSSLLDKYVSLRGDINQPLANAVDACTDREWLALDTLANVWPSFDFKGLTMLYLATDAQAISLVADKKRLCRPDIVIKCQAFEDWQVGDALDEIKRQHEALKPILGTFVISRHNIESTDWKKTSEAIDSNIHFVESPFVHENLNPIVQACRDTVNE